MTFMINWKSFIEGFRSIDKPLHFFKPEYWEFFFLKGTDYRLCIFTPYFHHNRGPFILFTFWRFSIFRCY